MTRETTEEITRKRWKQALDHLDQALLLATTEREQFLDSLGQRDAELRRTVSQLLDANSSNEFANFMESPTWSYQPIESNPHLLVGKRLGAYRLTQYLAKGGMGIVYLAERADKVFRRRVAVKIINADTGLSLFNRFRREVQILADLNHPNLVLLYDAGRMGDGRPFLVMEYVEGETLRDWLIQRGPMPLATVVEIIKQAAAGLHAAHEKGVIHRDIKPANIVVTESNNKGGKLTVKVLDFGIAARKQHDGSGVSSTKGAIGTLLYMSPEQLQSTKGRDLTPASDVYALGLTAYELLTGRPANDGQSQAEIITKHLYETPIAPSQKRPDLNITPDIDSVVLKALEKDADQRYQSAMGFADALKAAVEAELKDGNSDEQKVQLPRPTRQPSPDHQLSESAAGIPSQQRGHVKRIGAGAVFVALSLGGYWLWRELPKSDNSPPVAQLAASARPAAAKGLTVELVIEAENKTLRNCKFALFKPEITSLPTETTFENALVILEGIHYEPTGNTVERVAPESRLKQEVPPGSYFVHFECPGFPVVFEKTTVRKDPNSPGLARVCVTLRGKLCKP